MKRLYIVGAGGFGREMAAWCSHHPDNGAAWELCGFLDDNPAALDSFDYSPKTVLPLASHEPGPDECFVCGIGTPSVKRDACGRLASRGGRFLTLVHPSVILGKNVALGEGVVLCPGVIITCDVTLGNFVMANIGSTIGHDAVVEDWCTLSPHCDVTGGAHLHRGVFLGSHASILPRAVVGENAVVGAGAVVLRRVRPGATVFGVPAGEYS